MSDIVSVATSGATVKPYRPYKPAPLFYCQLADDSQATPSPLKNLVDEARHLEREFTLSLESKLKAAWHDVEATIQLNKTRCRLREEEDTSSVFDSVEQVQFWTKESVKQFFHFQSALVDTADASDGTATVMSSLSRLEEGRRSITDQSAMSSTTNAALTLGKIRLKLRKARRATMADIATKLSPTKARDNTTQFETEPSYHITQIVPEDHRDERRASNTAAEARELLDVDMKHAPLRRLFRGVLETRHTLPKELNLLLSSIDSLQKGEILQLEETIEKSALHVPVHVPLTRVAMFINRFLTMPSQGAAVELAFTEAYKPLLKKLEADYRGLKALWTVDDKESNNKGEASETMWQALLTELATRRDIQTDCRKALESAFAHEKEFLAVVPTELAACTNKVKQDFAALQADAATVQDAAEKSYQQTNEAMSELNRAYLKDRSYVDNSLKETMYKVQQSELAQEKLSRKIREAIKELHREQAKHEQYIEEMLHLKLVSKHIDVSRAQLSEHLNLRLADIQAAKDTCATLAQFLNDSEAVAMKILQGCDQHTNRVKTEEHFRECRLANIEVQNCTQWLRTVNDLMTLYETRHETVISKSESSWQLGYLLSQERVKSAQNLEAVKKEHSDIDAAWATVVAHLNALDLPVPPMDRADRGQEFVEMRQILKYVDDDAVISKPSSHIYERDKLSSLSAVEPSRQRYKDILETAAKSPSFWAAKSHHSQPKSTKDFACGATSAGAPSSARQPQRLELPQISQGRRVLTPRPPQRGVSM